MIGIARIVGLWLLLPGLLFAQIENSKAIEQVQKFSAAELEKGLPKMPFADWFAKLAGEEAKVEWEVNDCGEQTGDPKQDRKRDIPACVSAWAELPDGREVLITVITGTIKQGSAGKPRLKSIRSGVGGSWKEFDSLHELQGKLAELRSGALTESRKGAQQEWSNAEDTEARMIFALFFAIYMGTIVGLVRPLEPFDTAAMSVWNGKAWLRFVASIVMLNVIPLILFVVIYFGWLDSYKITRAGWPHIFGDVFFIHLASMVVFGVYRVFWGIMLLRWNNAFLFYGDSLPEKLQDRVAHHPAGCRVAIRVLPHLIPGLLWLLFTLGLPCIWFRNACSVWPCG